MDGAGHAATTPVKVYGTDGSTRADTVVSEEPLELRIAGTAVLVTMRTPGDDADLAHGLAVTERLVHSPADIAGADWGDPADFNVIDLELVAGAAPVEDAARRATIMSAACGLCGKVSIDDIVIDTPLLHDVPCVVEATVLTALPDRLAAAQDVFIRTGGLHAAGAFTTDGSVVVVREDVGRHNAVDKVVGALTRRGALPAHDLVLAVSGRAGFEIVQKAAVAGIPVVAAVSAPSSLAIDLADRAGITLAAFVRDGAANLYTHPQRVTA